MEAVTVGKDSKTVGNATKWVERHDLGRFWHDLRSIVAGISGRGSVCGGLGVIRGCRGTVGVAVDALEVMEGTGLVEISDTEAERGGKSVKLVGLEGSRSIGGLVEAGTEAVRSVGVIKGAEGNIVSRNVLKKFSVLVLGGHFRAKIPNPDPPRRTSRKSICGTSLGGVPLR